MTLLKRILAAISGVVLGVSVAWLLFYVTGRCFGPFYSSEDDMDRNVKILLMVTLAFGVIGGWVSARLVGRTKN